MQEFTTFDIIVIAITLLLGLKGLFKGFIKEASGLIGIIGGLFVASRFAELVGNEVAPLLSVQNEATKILIGFIATLIGFWILVYAIGMVISKVTEMSGLGIVDRTAGFIFGGAKIFLIFSVVAYLLVQVQGIKNTINKKDMIKNSTTFPLLVDTGSFIFKLDTSKFLSEDKAVKKDAKPSKTKEMKETIQKEIIQVKESMEKTANEVATEVKEESTKILADTIEKELTTSTVEKK